MESLVPLAQKVQQFYVQLVMAGRQDTYEAAHARLALDSIETIRFRQELSKEGALTPLSPQALKAANDSYIRTAVELCRGLENQIDSSKSENEAN